MRVLFTVFAAKTHLYNLVPMAWALRSAGHQVCIASQPDLMDAVCGSGLTGLPVGDELRMGGGSRGPTAQTFQGVSGDMVWADPDDMGWEKALGAFTVGCSVQYEYFAGGAMLDELVEFARDWQPDLVIWDALTFAGAIAARACGAAHARMLFGLDYVSRTYQRYRELLLRQPPERRDDPVSDWLRGRLDRYGLDFEEPDALELMTGQWSIDPTPPGMQFPLGLRYVPVRQVPYNGPASVPDWIHERRTRPRVALSLGMSGRDLMGGDTISVERLLAGLADFDIELVATLSAVQLASVSALPDHVRAVEFVPLNELLPTCAAVIHHGGFGTVVNVLTHGVPNLTVPAPWWDEADLGRHIAERGAGLVVAPEALGPDTLRTGLARLLNEPSFAEGAARVRDELLAVPSPHDLVPTIEALTAEHRTRR
ncbi:activator-dependent family glycosyltransferase [Streptomyces yanii]|uniref:Activator-dependent family glycosyltransferase n=1 Tax=Streptomyces yanii TaxID=78510 RepID=A0ABV5R5X0_9ACTN